MKVFRHPVLMMAVFLSAAMVIAPVAAAGVGQGMNQGIDQVQSGAIQVNQGYNPEQGNGQNSAGPGQGNRPGEIRNQTAGYGPRGGGPGNAAMSGNRTMNTPYAGNMTTPPDMRWNNGNFTAMGEMTRHGPGFGNETFRPFPRDGNGNNSTFIRNQTWHGHGSGNVSMPAPPPQGQGANQGQQTDQNQQQSKDEFIIELISWLKSHMST